MDSNTDTKQKYPIIERTNQAFGILSKNQDLGNFILIPKPAFNSGLKALRKIIEIQKLTIQNLESEKQANTD